MDAGDRGRERAAGPAAAARTTVNVARTPINVARTTVKVARTMAEIATRARTPDVDRRGAETHLVRRGCANHSADYAETSTPHQLERAMTQTNNRLIDELAKLATDAAAVAQGARREVEGAVRGQIERLLAEANVVHRDEFEAMKAMAVRAADEADTLRVRIAALEARVDLLQGRLEAVEGQIEAVEGRLSVTH